ASADDEAAAIAAAARHHNDRNVPWSSQAVLVRTNALATLLADALRGRDIPVRLRAQAPFLELAAVKESLAVLKRRGLTPGLADLEERVDEGELSDDDRMALTELLRLAAEYVAADPAASPIGFAGWLATTTADDADASGD